MFDSEKISTALDAVSDAIKDCSLDVCLAIICTTIDTICFENKVDPVMISGLIADSVRDIHGGMMMSDKEIKELAEENCAGCKHCAKAKQLIKGEWAYFYICTLFIKEGGEALYLKNPERDLCECFDAKGGAK